MIPAERAVGSMLLLAIGDALGAPVEGLKGPHILQIYRERIEDYADPLAPWREKPHRWRLKGLHTDDTQQALIVTETLLDHSGWNSKAAAEWYAALADPAPELKYGVHRGTGRNFRQCVQRMREELKRSERCEGSEGCERSTKFIESISSISSISSIAPPRSNKPNETGQAPKTKPDLMACGAPSAGPGAAKRIAPIGLWYAEDVDGLVEAAIECSVMTHADSRGILGAVAVALAVAALATASPEAVRTGAPAIAQMVHERIIAAEARLETLARERQWAVHFGSRPFACVLESLPGLLREQNDGLARQTILREANRHEPDHPISALNQAFAPGCVPAAIYRALRARSPMEGLIGVINDGYDTDTMGAITGAMLGARFGEGAIPSEWREGLLAAGIIAVRGEALAFKQKDLSRWDDLYAFEYDFSLREAKGREELIRAKEREDQKRSENQRARATAPKTARTDEKARKNKAARGQEGGLFPLASKAMETPYALAPEERKAQRRVRERRRGREEKASQRDRERLHKRDPRSDFIARGPLALYEPDRKEDAP